MTASASFRTSISITDPVLAELLDQLANQLQAGQPVDVEEFLRAHPERAEELRRLLPAVEVLATLEQSVDAGSISFPPGVESSGPEPGLLGDFRILGEIGRGGMGIVYEAEQVSLKRRVALKVLPFAAALDAKQLQRFKNEAQAAANLHHTSIVPVYYVGCERGLHFYAMQFIEGQTLAALIRELRTEAGLEKRRARIEDRESSEDRGSRIENGGSKQKASSFDPTPTGPYAPQMPGNEEHKYEEKEATVEEHCSQKDTLPLKPRSSNLHPQSSFFRTVAQLGIQAAEALDHAHQTGVIHRDIKPANLLVEFTPSPLGGEGRGEGDKARCDAPRLWITDFGLAHCQSQAGITMTGDLIGTLRYMSPEQALAKRVVVDHRTDIYSLGATLYELLTLEPPYQGADRQELLRQIAFEEPRTPRRINARIPAELETVVLKTMEKNPADRFATAQDLADDLRRFLEDKPIRARQPSPRQRIIKWARRHPSAVWAGVSAVAIAVVALAISLVFIAQAQFRTSAALKEAKVNYETARANFQLAREAVDIFSTKVSQDPRLKDQDLEELRKSLLQSGVEFYGRIAKQPGFGEELDKERARSYLQLTELTFAIRSGQEAVQVAEQARDFVEQLAHEYPENPDYQRDLATSYWQLAHCYGKMSASDDRVGLLFQESLGILQKLAQTNPGNSGYQSDLARVYADLGYYYRNTNRGERPFLKAQAILEKLIETHPDPYLQYRLARCCNRLLEAYLGQGRLDQAESVSQKARTLLEKLVLMYPNELDYQLELGMAYNNLGEIYLVKGPFTKAAEGFEKALPIWDRLANEHPNLREYKNRQAMLYVHLGKTNHLLGRFDRAQVYYEKAVGIYQQLWDNQPKDEEYSGGVGWASFGLGRLLKDKGDPEASFQWLTRALSILEGLELWQLPDHALPQSWTRQSYFYRAEVLNQLGRHGEALQDWDRALGLATEHDTAYRAQEFRALARLGQAVTRAYQGDYLKATSDVEDVLAKPPGGSRGLPFAASCVYSVAAAAVRNDGKLDSSVREKIADQYAARSLVLLEQAQAEQFFATPLNVYFLKRANDLDILRDRKDFKTLLARVEKTPTTSQPEEKLENKKPEKQRNKAGTEGQ